LNTPRRISISFEAGERMVDVVELAEICRAYGRRLVEFVRGLNL
jgi:hypothetical protein